MIDPASPELAVHEGVPDATAGAPSRPAALRLATRLIALFRPEDWVLAGFVVAFGPSIARTSPGGPFDGGHPVDGAFRLVAVLAALACVAARRPAARSGEPHAQPFLASAAVGPFSGGLLLVAISGGAALDLPPAAASGFVAIAAATMVVVRLTVPPLPGVVRRALVTPFVLATGAIFWSVVGAVFARPLVTGGLSGIGGLAGLRSLVSSPAFLFLAAFAAVYYAMLVYAPRQIAEPEGGPLAWAMRYVMFLAGVTLGVGWLAAFGG